MPRGPRLKFRNGIYHVMARGNRKGAIFEDERDRERLIEILAEAVERHNVVVHAECRMGNHLHAVIRTPEANVSEFMNYWLSSFSQYSNHRHGRLGHLFGERFKAVLIDNDCYLRVAIGYVEKNPVAAGLVASPTEWTWSSCQATLGLAPVPTYLSLDWLDAAFPAASRSDSRRKYLEYLRAPTIDDAEAQLHAPASGSAQFVEAIRTHIGAILYLASLPRSYRALDRPPLEALFPPGQSKEQRAAAIVRAHVVHAYRLSEIARCLDIHPNTVSRIVAKLRRRVRD